MAQQVTNYKCPACTGPLHYDGDKDKLICDYCGGEFPVAEIEAMYAADNSAAVEAAQAQQDSADVEGWALDESGTAWGADANVKAFNCPSCGAELICDDTTAAASCPYCDNPTVIPASVHGSLKPDLVIPFKYDKQQAKAAFKEHMKGKKLLPRLFSDEAHLDEIKGVYVPFWLYDADADAHVVYSGTRSRTWSDAEFDYVETQYFDLVRSGGIGFENVPVDASEKMDNTLMESIEPYDISQAVDFKTAYLAGYMADRYDVSADSCVDRANTRITQSVKDAFLSTTAGFSSVAPKSTNIRLSRSQAKYALMPVWLLNTTWHDEKYVFAMNGQTGKFVGDLPYDPQLKRKWHFVYSGIIAAALLAVELLMHLM